MSRKLSLILIVYCIQCINGQNTGDTLFSPTYGRDSGEETNIFFAIDQGFINGISSWGNIQDVPGQDWEFLYDSSTLVYWTSTDRTFMSGEPMGSRCMAGVCQIYSCNGFSIDPLAKGKDKEYITGTRAYYSTGQNGPGPYIYGMGFKTNKGNEYICVYGNEYDVDTGWYEPGDGYYLSGFIYDSAYCIDGIQYQFTFDASLKKQISGGSVFIIIVIVVFFVYFVGGYLFNAYKNGCHLGDYSNNIPNKGFWITLPKAVLQGCMVTKGLFSKKKEGQLVETE
mmetsp:Transcript_84181/g.103143  ORF Transcript_84181/g.103143 Transcript_84181/m.103143 type:complete len:282 (+) Transcript_84181:73-918(+)